MISGLEEDQTRCRFEMVILLSMIRRPTPIAFDDRSYAENAFMFRISNKMPPSIHLDEIMPRDRCERPALMSDRRGGVYLAQAPSSDRILYSTRGLKAIVRALNQSRRAHSLLLPTHAYRVCWGKHSHHKLVVFRHTSKNDFAAMRSSLNLVEV